MNKLILFITVLCLLSTLNSYSQTGMLNENMIIYKENKVKTIKEYRTLDNNKLFISQSSFNSSGQIINSVFYDDAGKVIQKITYDYSANNMVVESNLLVSDNSVSKTKYLYNSNGQLVEIISDYDKSTFKYDDKGNMISQMIFQDSGGWYEFYFEYNESRLIIKSISKYGVTKYTYNNDNRMIQSLTYDNDDILQYGDEYSYLDNKLLSESKSFMIENDNKIINNEKVYEYEFY